MSGARTTARLAAALVLLLWSNLTFAADAPVYGPPPSWVMPIQAPTSPAGGGAVQVLLADSQIRFGDDDVELYNHAVVKLLTPQGVAAVGNLIQVWNPDTDVLTIHRLWLIRDGKFRDLLAGGKKLTVLRRERNLEMAMLDGTLTATFQPEDLRVGDELEIATTFRRHDPVLKGHYEAIQALPPLGITGRIHLRDLWPRGKPIRWRAPDGIGEPKVSTTAAGVELAVDLKDFAALEPPAGAPARFRRMGQLQLSGFADWAQASSLVDPLYAKAATLEPGSPLELEASKIAAASADPKARVLAALQLVQQQTRYLFLGMDLGGLTPASADVTWKRRFGDCKGKTALLLALLGRLGVKAQPALVATVNGDGMDERLPSLQGFDHVIVRAEIDGKVYWLDGARPYDYSLDDLPVPNFGWALPVQTADAKLERLNTQPYAEPQIDQTLRLDASAGLDKPAPAHAEMIERGDAAMMERQLLQAVTPADLDRGLRQYWSNKYPWIAAGKVGFIDDRAVGRVTVSLDGLATMEWTAGGGERVYDIGESGLGGDFNFNREPGPHADAPFAVDYPVYAREAVVIVLPAKGEGFHLAGGADIDRTVAGVAYLRRSRIADGVMTMQASQRSLVREFPADQAPAAAVALRAMAAADVVVRTSDASTLAAAEGPDSAPTEATGLTARGMELMAKGKYDLAIADLDQAVRSEPKVAKRYYNRGVAHFEANQDKLALADFDQALRLAPSDRLALMARGELELLDGREAAGARDFDQAAKLAPTDSTILARRADAYFRAGKYEAAIGYFDRWLSDHPDDRQRPGMLANRCWAQARWGRNLDIGLAECDAAVKAARAGVKALDGRGLIALRLGHTEMAIADFTAVQQATPDAPWPLYARGVAELRAGLKAAAESDMLAARTLDPKIADNFAEIGVKP
jgi:tetratricopeptide (TPR) repeat protein/transglutaminase-like putative cysteine protease